MDETKIGKRRRITLENHDLDVEETTEVHEEEEMTPKRSDYKRKSLIIDVVRVRKDPDEIDEKNDKKLTRKNLREKEYIDELNENGGEKKSRR